MWPVGAGREHALPPVVNATEAPANHTQGVVALGVRCGDDQHRPHCGEDGHP